MGNLGAAAVLDYRVGGSSAGFFTLHSTKKFSWKLNDHYSAGMVEVDAVMNTENVVGILGLNQIISDFERRGIIQNLNISGIHAELQNPTYQPIPAARGRAAVPGRMRIWNCFSPRRLRMNSARLKARWITAAICVFLPRSAVKCWRAKFRLSRGFPAMTCMERFYIRRHLQTFRFSPK